MGINSECLHIVPPCHISITHVVNRVASNSSQSDNHVKKSMQNNNEIEMIQSSNSKPEDMAMTTCAAYGDIKLTNCAAYGEISNNIPNESLAVYETV